jgi:hypothetical protein
VRVPAKAAIAERPEPARLHHTSFSSHSCRAAQPDCGLFDKPRVIKLGPQQPFSCESVLPQRPVAVAGVAEDDRPTPIGGSDLLQQAACIDALTIVSNSVERQRCSIFVVVHACEVKLRIHVPCSAEEEFIERFQGAWPQWILDATESDLREVRLCPSNLNKLELVREDLCPL